MGHFEKEMSSMSGGSTPRAGAFIASPWSSKSYSTELLLKKGYEAHGLVRRASVFDTDRIDHRSGCFDHTGHRSIILAPNPTLTEKILRCAWVNSL